MPPSAATFRAIVSGERPGPLATAARALLRCAESPYTLAVRWRNWRYDTGRAAVHRVGVPVVSVGNITLGGTGKTPMVEWLARWFAERGVRVAIVSRGYAAGLGTVNDEARELAAKLRNVPHVQDPDRVAAARRAIDQHKAQLILLDDGFQHRRLARDLDIVLVDALTPFGFGHVFPRGMLREPLAGLARANVVALSRADLVSDAERAAIRSEVARHAPNATWIEVGHAPRALLASSGREQPVQALSGQPIAAFCGIGNPTGFRRLLERCGYRLLAFREFADHHSYGPGDVQSLAAWVACLDVAAVVCTHKDLVKLPHECVAGKPLWALQIGLEILAGQPQLEALLEPLARSGRQSEATR